MSYSIHLRTLEASGLVSLASVLPEVEYLFRHTLIQEAAYSSLLKSDRQALHSITGLVLEDIYEDRSEEIAPILAQHFFAAQDFQRALRYFTLSGDKAMAIYAIPEAIEYYKVALEIAKKNLGGGKNLPHLFIQLGGAYELNAQYERAIAGYREMEALAIESKDEGMRLTAIILLAKVYATPSSVHDADNVQALSDQALELSIKTNDKEAQARIYWILCLVTARNGKFIESIIHGEKALELARELGNDELLAYTLHDLSQSYGGIYQLDKGYEALRESQSLWHKLGNLVMLVDNLSTMLIFDYFEGEYDQAIMNYKEAAVLSESIGNLWGQAYCRMYIGSIYIDRGQIEEGIQIMKKCLVLAKEAGFIVPLLQTQAELGLVYAYLGDSERGLDTIDIALKFSDQEITGWKSWVKAIKARVFIQLNELEKSRALLHSAELDLQEGDPLGFARVYFRAVHCELALAEKDYPKALELSQLFEEDILSDVLMLVPWLYYLRGVILLKVGQIQEAQMVLDKAINTAEKMQMRRMIWQIQIVLADLADLQGEVEQARQLRNQAKATINYIAERIGSEDLRKSFMDRPDVIALWETK